MIIRRQFDTHDEASNASLHDVQPAHNKLRDHVYMQTSFGAIGFDTFFFNTRPIQIGCGVDSTQCCAVEDQTINQ